MRKRRSLLNELLLVALFGIGSLGCQVTSGGSGTGGNQTGGSSGNQTGGSSGSQTGGSSGSQTGGSSGNQTGGSSGSQTGGSSGDKPCGGDSDKTFDPTKLPCDIYADDGGPCVAAHSTVRRLKSAYTGNLYQVRVGGSKTGTGGTPAEIGFGSDGFADAAAQDTACGTGACTISIIYDQSGNGNDLTVAPPGGAKTTADNEANAKALPITISGHNVYGEKNPVGVGYRNNSAKGTATGDDPQTVYMIVSRSYFNTGCCFDYGNAETNSKDNGEGTMEAVYFGSSTNWNCGGGDGPWIMGDLENGLWAGDSSPYDKNGTVPDTYTYVVGLVKGEKKSKSCNEGNGHWTIKIGNAQSGTLAKPFDGSRPNAKYNPMRKEGAIILGTGGDNSSSGQGNFFEGVMTAHYSSNAADDAVQANIVSVYGQ
jgi:hypothetical protein